MFTKSQIDMLTGGVRIARLVEERRRRDVTAKLRGVAERLKKFHHGLDHEADKLDKRISATEQRAGNVFAQSHANLDAAHQVLDGVDEYLTEIEKTNSPLDDSKDAPRSTTVALDQQRKAG